MRALFLSTNTARAAGVRYRMLQYFAPLRAAGIECQHRSLFDERLDRIIYTPGRTLEKIARLAAAAGRRIRAIMAARRYDVVVLLREAFLVGPPLLEALLRELAVPVVFDVDDAVWQPYESPTYGHFASVLKCAWKTRWIVQWARCVTAGNRYLVDHLRGWNPNVTLVPTVVDTDAYQPAPTSNHPEPVLGWIGSHSTLQYLKPLLPILERLALHRRFRLKVIGAGSEVQARLPIENLAWTCEREIADIRSFDIGLFPIVEDAWSRGKSGFKAVQYGAVGIPTVASPVTTNRDIVLDGVTGLLADTPDAWMRALQRLLDDVDLRHRLGRAARARIVEHYSLRAHAPRFAEILQSAATRTR